MKMSDTHGLTKENLLFTFPVGLRKNPSIAALGDVTMEALAKRPAEIRRLSIYPRIEELPEELLDILARDFKVDWWDPDYSLEEKRRVFKDSWYVHKHLGTKAAVETALRAIYPKAAVQEWFEYEGGRPYHFKLNIDLTGEVSDAARPWRVIQRVNFYKSLRSHMDKIVFNFVLPPAALHVGGGVGAQPSIGVPLQPDEYDFQGGLHLGGGVGAQPSIGVPLGPDEYDFQGSLHLGGRVGAQTEFGIPAEHDIYDFQATIRAGGSFSGKESFPVPEDTTQPPATTILRSGGVFTFISNLSGED